MEDIESCRNGIELQERDRRSIPGNNDRSREYSTDATKDSWRWTNIFNFSYETNDLATRLTNLVHLTQLRKLRHGHRVNKKDSLSNGKDHKDPKPHPKHSSECRQCCFVIVRTARDPRAVQVLCNRPSKQRGIPVKFVDDDDDDAAVWARIERAMCKYHGTWKKWLPYYGPRTVREVTVCVINSSVRPQ